MTKPETNYTFWIETKTGEEIYWDGLTKRQKGCVVDSHVVISVQLAV